MRGYLVAVALAAVHSGAPAVAAEKINLVGDLDRTVAFSSGARLWENTALVVPPGRTRADSKGSVLFSLGCDETVWRADYAAVTQPAGSAAAAKSPAPVRQSLAALIPPDVTLSVPGRLGSCDNILARLPDRSLMLVRQAVITGSANGGARHQKTGAEVVFVSRDEGATWEYVSVIDPFDPAFANGRYGRTKEQGGLDRPELFVPPSGDRVFMSLHGLGDSAANGLIFVTTAPFGKRWRLVESSLPYTAPYMMTATREQLIVFNLQNGLPNNYDAVIRWYDLAKDGGLSKPNGPFMVAAKDAYSGQKEMRGNTPTAVDDGSVAIAVAEQRRSAAGSETYVRVAYPHVDGGRQVVRTHVVRIAGNSARLVPERSLTLSAESGTGSVLDFVSVESNSFDLPSAPTARPVLYYWKETEKTPVDGLPGDGWGKVVVRGQIVRGAQSEWSEPFVLSRNPDNTPRSWIGQRRTGDYGRGAFFYDPSAADSFRYLVQWVETPFSGTRSGEILHTNVVSIKP
jgi:hypothetical protein